MSTVTASLVTINTEADCGYGACTELAHRIYTQLNVPKYTRGMSVMPTPASVEEWRQEHRTARKRADRAERLGYTFAVIDRSQHNDAIHEINTSLKQRQGRPMSDGYVKRHNHGPLPVYLCERHRIHTYGILQGDTLRAYLSLYRVGDLAMISMILGHGQHLDAGIMYLLVQGVIAAQVEHGGWFFYNRHDSGEAGLAWMKERLGFRETDIEFQL